MKKTGIPTFSNGRHQISTINQWTKYQLPLLNSEYEAEI